MKINKTVRQNKHKVICTNKKPPLSKEHHVIHNGFRCDVYGKQTLPPRDTRFQGPISHPIVFTTYRYICGASTTYSWPIEAKKKKKIQIHHIEKPTNKQTKAGILTNLISKPILKRTLSRNDKQKPVQYSFLHPIYQELAELIPDIHKLKKIYKYII